MDQECDGGGNRYLSVIRLANYPKLATNFQGRQEIPAGVCSIQLQPNQNPWIVCPRRLLFFGGQHHHSIQSKLYGLLKYKTGTRLGIWSEVKISKESNGKLFNYTFDYILIPVQSIPVNQINFTSQQTIERAGYCITRQNGQDIVEDFPRLGENPVIIEIMTASTSGGNKQANSSITQACVQALQQGQSHSAPSINKRQVVGRMLSQFFAKSEAAVRWGGYAIWIIQDVLADYISTSTALDLQLFDDTNSLNDINVIIAAYSNSQNQQSQQPIPLSVAKFVSNSLSNYNQPAFEDVLRAPFYPGKETLLAGLAKQKPLIITVP